MKLFIVTIQFLLFFSLIKTFHAAFSDPTMDVLFHTIDVKVSPGNPYFGDASGHVGDDSKTLFVKLPIKKTLPENTMVQLKNSFSGVPYVEIEIEMCDLFDPSTFGSYVSEYLIPSDEVPEECPVVANEKYEIYNYTLDMNTIPPDAPDGSIESAIKIFQPDEDVYVIIDIKGEVSHEKLKEADALPEVPGFGR